MSPTDAWAVGESNPPTGTSIAKILHWDGTTWSREPIPDAAISGLSSVSADSPTDAWAVGEFVYENQFKALTLHWNGTAWTRVAVAHPGAAFTVLTGVTALSPTDALAVGYRFKGNGLGPPVALHWNGIAWTEVDVPGPKPADTTLTGVSADSPTDAWASEERENNDGIAYTFLLHWDGVAWSAVATPRQGSTGNRINAVNADSPTDAWAVGFSNTKTGIENPLILHWNGVAWSIVENLPLFPLGATLRSVSVDSPTDAWAVGYTQGPGWRTLIYHWNGSDWSSQTGVNPGTVYNQLDSVSSDSPGDAWMVGYYQVGATSKIPGLILHWNGTTLSRS